MEALEIVLTLSCTLLIITIAFFATKPKRILRDRILFAIRRTSTDKLQAPVTLNDVTTFFSRQGWRSNSTVISKEINTLVSKSLIRRDVGYKLQLTNLGMIRLGRIVRGTPKCLEPQNK